MAMETTAMPTGIRPIERPQGPQTTGVQRRGTPSASPFAPRTDVSLQNSVADVANLLSKIASTKEEAMEKISPQVQKLIDSIMQQSFSLESTLAEGLGTTLESQRFAMDQMFTLARMLHQMGSLAEQGKPAALSDELQALFAGVKEMMMTEEGKDMAPTMLHKLAFEVLDGKQAEDLPEMMQFLLAQQGASMPAAAAAQPESDTFGFMKQLMDYFMPHPGADESGSTQEYGGPQAQEGSGETAQGRATGEPGTTREMSGAQEGIAPRGEEAAAKENGVMQKGGEAAPRGNETAAQGDEKTLRAAQEGQKNAVRDGATPEQAAQTGGAKESAAGQKTQEPINWATSEQAAQTGETKESAAGQKTQEPMNRATSEQNAQTGETKEGAAGQKTQEPMNRATPEQAAQTGEAKESAAGQKTQEPMNRAAPEQNAQTGETKEGAAGQKTQEPMNRTASEQNAQTGETKEGAAGQKTQEPMNRATSEQAVPTGEAKESAAGQKTQEPVNSAAAEQTKEPRASQQTEASGSARGQSTQTESAASRRGGESNAQIYAQENETTEEQAGMRQKVEVNPQDPFAELMRKGLERMRGRIQQQGAQPQQNGQGEMPQQGNILGRMPQSPAMQNTPRMMEAMKQLASMVMENAQLTQEDEQLLLNFVNNDQAMLSERDAKELQALLQLCEKNVPASVLQSAQQKGMEDFPRLWAFMQLCDLAMIKERDGKALKRAGKSISDFASMMKHSLLPENGRTPEGHRSMSFMTPLYMSDEMQKPYPAYIHVYDEDKKDENGGPSKKETWIRVCLLTENIGAVDVSFRMYEETNLDVRIYFSERENLEEFRDYMDEFRASFDDKPLTLMSVKVGVAGAKT